MGAKILWTTEVLYGLLAFELEVLGGNVPLVGGGAEVGRESEIIDAHFVMY
jgi:hypothetical protein